MNILNIIGPGQTKKLHRGLQPDRSGQDGRSWRSQVQPGPIWGTDPGRSGDRSGDRSGTGLAGPILAGLGDRSWPVWGTDPGRSGGQEMTKYWPFPGPPPVPRQTPKKC